LLVKLYNDSQLSQVERSLKSKLEGLKTEIKICGASSRGWVQVSVSGEDEKVAVHYLADKIGLCPIELQNVGKYLKFKGFLIDPTKTENELHVDIGIFSPSNVDAVIPLHRLQSQLGDGRKIALGKLAELFGFCQNLPLHIRVTSVDLQKRCIEAELSEKQQSQYADWTRSLLDRLLVLGASYNEVKAAIKMTQSSRDIVRIEPLGIFEHAVVCKLGTDAAGLIPKIGKNLRKATLSVFNPRKILGLFGSNSTLSIS
jgi:hypothetical protein